MLIVKAGSITISRVSTKTISTGNSLSWGAGLLDKVNAKEVVNE